MTMHRMIPLLIFGSFSLSALTAQAGVYSWKDADGKVHYGDRPPAEKQGDSRQLPAAPPVDSNAAQKDLADRQMANREKQQKAQDESKKAQENQAEAAQRQQNCQDARANLSGVESGQVRYTMNANGERVVLDGAVRDAELAKARKAVSEWCSPPPAAAKK